MSTTKPSRKESLQRILQTARSIQQQLTPQPRLAKPASVPPLKLVCPPDVEHELDTVPQSKTRIQAILNKLIVSYEERFTEACYERAAHSAQGQLVMEQLRTSLQNIFLQRVIPMISSYISRCKEVSAQKSTRTPTILRQPIASHSTTETEKPGERLQPLHASQHVSPFLISLFH